MVNILRGSVHTLVAQLLGAASTAALGVFIARELGPAGFGAYALALAFVMLLAPVADLGISLAAARELATAEDPATRGWIYANAAVLKLVTTALLALPMYFLAGSIASAYGSHRLGLVFRAATLALVGQSFLTFFWSTLIAERRGRLNLSIVVVRVTTEVALTVAVVLTGHGAAGATLSRGVAHCSAAAVGFLVVFWRPSGRVRPTLAAAVRLSKSALGLAIVEISYGALFQVDIVMISVFMAPVAVGLYQAPLRVITPITYLGVALAAGLAPMVARETLNERRRTMVAWTLCALAFGEAALMAVVFARADDVISLFGHQFGASVHVLRLLSPYIFVAGFAPVASLLVTYLGNIRARAIIGISALAFNLLLDVTLIPAFGLTGAAVAADISALYYVGCHCWLAMRVLGLRPWVLADVLGRAAAVGSLLAAMLFFGRRGGVGGLPISTVVVSMTAVGLLVYAFRAIAPRQVERLASVGDPK